MTNKYTINVILKEFVVGTLPSYTSVSNADVGNTI